MDYFEPISQTLVFIQQTIQLKEYIFTPRKNGTLDFCCRGIFSIRRITTVA
jgi:hypothetical protein